MLLLPLVMLHTAQDRYPDKHICHFQALKHLLEAKMVDYDFEFYKLPMPADVAVVILSRGKALLQQYVDIVLPLRSLVANGTALPLCIKSLFISAAGLLLESASTRLSSVTFRMQAAALRLPAGAHKHLTKQSLCRYCRVH